MVTVDVIVYSLRTCTNKYNSIIRSAETIVKLYLGLHCKFTSCTVVTSSKSAGADGLRDAASRPIDHRAVHIAGRRVRSIDENGIFFNDFLESKYRMIYWTDFHDFFNLMLDICSYIILSLIHI